MRQARPDHVVRHVETTSMDLKLTSWLISEQMIGFCVVSWPRSIRMDGWMDGCEKCIVMLPTAWTKERRLRGIRTGCGSRFAWNWRDPGYWKRKEIRWKCCGDGCMLESGCDPHSGLAKATKRCAWSLVQCESIDGNLSCARSRDSCRRRTVVRSSARDPVQVRSGCDPLHLSGVSRAQLVNSTMHLGRRMRGHRFPREGLREKADTLSGGDRASWRPADTPP